MTLMGARLREVAAEVDLAPAVRLDPASQRDFQRAVEDRGIAINYVERAEAALECGRKHPHSRQVFRVKVGPRRLMIEHAFPELSLTGIVQEMDEVIRAAFDTLNPSVLAAFRLRIRKQAAVPGGDARLFLGDRILQLPEERKQGLGRPILTVGVKFFMPPYTLRGKDGEVTGEATDGVEVRIESLNEDISDLYLECTRYIPRPLEPAQFDSLRADLDETDAFINTRVARFLEPPAEPEEPQDE